MFAWSFALEVFLLQVLNVFLSMAEFGDYGHGLTFRNSLKWPLEELQFLAFDLIHGENSVQAQYTNSAQLLGSWVIYKSCTVF